MSSTMNPMSLKDRLTLVQKRLQDLRTNTKTYHQEIKTLKEAKDSFDKVFKSKNSEVRLNITNQLERVHQQLQRHLNHHKNQNNRIQQQLAQLRDQKVQYQQYLRAIREKLEDIERSVGQS